MNRSNGALSFEAYMGTDDFARGMKRMEDLTRGTTRTIVNEADKIDDTLKRLGAMAAGYFAFDQVSSLPKHLISIRGEFQNLEISYKTMLNSKAEADKLMADVTKFAATTPFDLKGVASASKMLLAYGFEASNVTKILTRLGDISAGLNIPLGELTELYGKTKVEGRVMAEDLNQYVGRGIPLIKLLAEQFGVAESEVRGLVEQGKVGFPQVEKAINKLTDTGGTFAGLMKEQSEGLLGLYSNFEDTIEKAFNNIGKSQEGLLAGSIKTATTIVENYEPILDGLKVIIAGYGAYRAAIIATAATQALATKGGAIMAWLELAAGIRSAKDAQIAFNLATKANPYAVAASALITLVTAVALFSKESTEATRSQERALEITERLNQKHAEETTKVQLLAKQIADESLTRDQRNKKLQELIAISPEHFKALTIDTIATSKGADAIRDYIKALEQKLALQTREEQIIANNKRIRDINTGVLDDDFEPNLFERAKLFLEDSGFDEKKFKAEMEKRKKAAVQGLKQENEALLKESAAAATKLDKTTTPPTDPPAKKAATATAAKEEKEIRVKTFAEEIEEKKRMYELYDRWVLNYGQASADEQFATLIGKNKDYLAYVNHEIERLEYIRDAGYMGKFSDQDKFDLDRLIGERSSLTGGTSPIDQFREKLDAVRDSSESLTDELIKLKEIQQGLNPNDNSSTAIAQRMAFTTRELEVQKQRKQLLRDFLVTVTGSEQKRTEITKYYADLRAGVEAKAQDKTSAGYTKMIAAIDKKEKDELNAFELDVVKGSEAYKELEKIVALSTDRQTKMKVDALRGETEIIKAQFGEQSEEYQQHLLRLRQAEEDHRQRSIQNWQTIAGVVGELGDTLESMGGTIGEIGGALSGLARNSSAVTSVLSMKDGEKLSVNEYAAAIQGVIQMVTTLIGASKRRAEAERQFAAARLGFENDYQLALNKKKGDNYNDNPFYQDFEGQIKAGVDQYKDAMDKYQAAIDKLEEGRAKERQKNVVDGKTVGQLAGAGAAAGAVIGGIVGVGVFSAATAAVGAVIGAAVGAITGLFAKKKKDVYGALMEQYPELVQETADGWAELNVEMAQALITNGQVDDKTRELLDNAIALNEAMQDAKQQIQGTMVDLSGQVGDNLKDALVEAFRAGDSAAQALHQTVGEIISDITSKLLFSALVGPALDQLVLAQRWIS